MSRSVLYLVIGLLAAGVVVVGYLYYQESRSGIEALAKQLDARVEGTMDATGTIVSITHAPFPSRLPAPETVC